MPMPDRYAASWVPDDVDEDDAAGLALDWAEAVDGDGDGDVLLVCNGLSGHVPPALRGLPAVSPRSRSRARQWRGNRVIALRPLHDTLETAHDLALDGALCVMAGYNEDLSPWVARTDAVNLYDPPGEPPRLPGLHPDVAQTMDSILFFGGRNGFIGAGEKEHLIGRLRGLLADGHRPPTEDLTAYLRASGKTSERGVKRFAKYYQGLLDGREFRDYARRPI
jgi:hypothetical protein